MENKLIKILIVDDEVGIRNGLKHFINWEQEGYTIVGDVSNGKEALTQVRIAKPDIIISDIVMPEMDGVKLMKAIHKLYPEIGVVILSSHDDFKYVKTVMQYGADDYLLKTNLTPNELLSMLNKVAKNKNISSEKNINFDSNYNLNRFLTGFSSDEEKQRINNSILKTPSYLIMTNHTTFSNIEQEKKDIFDFFQENLTDDILLLASIGETTVLLIQSSLEYNILETIFKKTTETLITKYPYLFFIYSEQIFNSDELKKISNIIGNSLSQERFVNKGNNIICISDLTPIEELSSFDMKYYLLSLTNRQFIQSLDYLDQYFKENINKNIEESSLHNLFSSTIYNYISSLEETHGESNELTVLKLNILSIISELSYLADFQGLFDDIKHQLTNITEKMVNSYDGKLAQLLEDYIREHSSEKVSLKELAQEFHFSYSYLSSYFSSAMNESFNDFLNRIRIDKSTDLLKNNTLTISEISKEVGYSDVSYFSKVFKKIKGETPMKYRRRARK